MSKSFEEFRWGNLLEIVETRVDMKDEDIFPLASIRRRNGGFFHRETKFGKDILTKTLSKAAPGSFAISRMQVVHGACSYVPENYTNSFLSASYTQFKAKNPPYIDTKFMHYYAHSHESYSAFLKSSHGVHIEKMTFDLKDWLKQKVRLPPLPEQKKIASILTSVDEVIEKTQKQIDKLQDLKRATMNELLTRGIGHAEFKGSKLGRIPKSWEIKKVSQLTKEHKQGFYTKDRYQGNGVFLIRITDLQNPKIDYSEMPKLPVSEKDFNAFKVDVGDFLFARSGAIGRYGIVSENYPAVFASYLIRFKFNDTVDTKFFGYIYESEYCQNQLSYITQGSSNININAENIKSLTVPYPQLVEQRKIASVLLSIDKNIEDKRHKLHQTQFLKKSLMQDLLTGKVRAKVN